MRQDLDLATDNELVRLALDNRECFGVLYDRYAARIYKFSYRRLGNRSEAEDASSAIFIRALERLASFRGGSFAAWMFAIARTTVTDHFRARVVEALPHTFDPVDPGPSPLDSAISNDETRTVRHFLEALSSDQRDVVELRLAGLTGAEIAESMNKSVAAIKMLQLRAMKRMREFAVDHNSEEPQWKTE